jgi:hypothetical protein
VRPQGLTWRAHPPCIGTLLSYPWILSLEVDSVVACSVLLAHAPGRVDGEIRVRYHRPTDFTRVVGARGKALEGTIDIVQHPGRLSQLGFISLFHASESTAGVKARRVNVRILAR